MKLYTDKENIQVIGAEYLRIIGFGYPVQVFSMAMSALLRSTERVRIPLFASIASVASNIFLNWVFIYGKFGLPEMGVRRRGAGNILGGGYQRFGHFDFGACAEVPISDSTLKSISAGIRSR